MNRIEKTEVIKGFMSGRNCAQTVLGAFADDAGYDIEETDKMTASFGGGMLTGETCGAVTGALLALNMLADTPEDACTKTKAFQEKFREAYKSTMCRDLIKYDFADPEQGKQAFESGIMLELCPDLVLKAIEIVEELTEDK